MSLEEAGKLLGGLHPNTVRNRAAKGKIPYEKDNQGKWFVFLDPDLIANDQARRGRVKPDLEVPKEPTMEPQIVSSLKALETTIEVLNHQLEATRSDRDTIKAERDAFAARLDERIEVAIRLEVALAALTARNEAAEGQVELLRVKLEEETDANRKMLLDALERMTAPPKPEPAPQPAEVSPGEGQGAPFRFFRLFGSRKA